MIGRLLLKFVLLFVFVCTPWVFVFTVLYVF